MNLKNFKWGHMASQKFAGFIFGAFLCLVAGISMSEGKGSTVVMGIVGLYTAFVGGRAWSDNAAIRWGGNNNRARDPMRNSSIDIQVRQGALKREGMMADPEEDEENPKKEKDDEID